MPVVEAPLSSTTPPDPSKLGDFGKLFDYIRQEKRSIQPTTTKQQLTECPDGTVLDLPSSTQSKVPGLGKKQDRPLQNRARSSATAAGKLKRGVESQGQPDGLLAVSSNDKTPTRQHEPEGQEETREAGVGGPVLWAWSEPAHRMSLSALQKRRVAECKSTSEGQLDMSMTVLVSSPRAVAPPYTLERHHHDAVPPSTLECLHGRYVPLQCGVVMDAKGLIHVVQPTRLPWELADLVDQYGVAPRYFGTRDDKMKLLGEKLAPLWRDDKVIRHGPWRPTSRKIHVFVDLSNVIVGFFKTLKTARGLPDNVRVRNSPFLFESLAHILERGRPCATRVTVGSVGRHGAWPDFMHEAASLGYEMNIMQRIRIPADREEQDSPGAIKLGEQAVDEVLQLKMLQRLCSRRGRPGTIVLATGDAAKGQFSDGFLTTVEMALKHGWHVEVISWRTCLSSAWRAPAFRQRWAGRFRLVELDLFLEELLNICISPHAQLAYLERRPFRPVAPLPHPPRVL